MAIAAFDLAGRVLLSVPNSCGPHAAKAANSGRKGFGLTRTIFGLKKRYYIVLVSRDEGGKLRKVPLPLHYIYGFVAVAAIGAFTVAGLAGSYSRMLIKTARFNELRVQHDSLQKDYAHLEKQAHEKDVQAASLGSLASEVSALYGLTASKLAAPMGRVLPRSARSAGTAAGTVATAGTAAGVAENVADNDSDASYYKSLDTFYSLRNSAISGTATHAIDGGIDGLGTLSATGGTDVAGSELPGSDLPMDAPNLWPVIGPITSSFGQREDPVLHNGEGEFHSGVDISAPVGTPVRATADGIVKSAEVENGYGREVIVDHGHGLETCYAHMSGFAVMAGQTVVRGQVIGYVGTTGRTTGANLHYEVRIHNAPVNPHKYMLATIAGLGAEKVGL
jgi:murein DD-endopeptidase MepM/ murein hydrolase activator NlpD